MKIMDEIRVAEIRRERGEDNDIEFLLDLIERGPELNYPDYYESEDRVDELEIENINLKIEVKESKREVEELRKTTISINLGDYI